MILVKTTREKTIFRNVEDYNGVSLKKIQRIVQKLKNAFLAKFSIFL